MPGEKVIEQCGARAADMQIAGRTRSETCAKRCHAAKLTGGKNCVNGALKIGFNYAIIDPFIEEHSLWNRRQREMAQDQRQGAPIARRLISFAISLPKISSKAKIKEGCTPAFRRSRTAIFTSVMQSRSVSTSVWRRSSVDCAIFVSTTRTRVRKTSSTSNRSNRMCAGSASIGAIGNITHRIISRSFFNLQSS